MPAPHAQHFGRPERPITGAVRWEWADRRGGLSLRRWTPIIAANGCGSNIARVVTELPIAGINAAGINMDSTNSTLGAILKIGPASTPTDWVIFAVSNNDQAIQTFRANEAIFDKYSFFDLNQSLRESYNVLSPGQWSVVPEPSSCLCFGGMLGLGFLGRRIRPARYDAS